MSNITDAIENVASGINNSVNEGFRTLADLIRETMESGGSSEASAFYVSINEGPELQIVSDADTRLNLQVSDADKVVIRKDNTATAGRV